jgi:hypothetical protein
MDAKSDQLSLRSSYNMAGMSFTAKEQADSIKNKIPGFKVSFKPDFRQAIADSWPVSIDDSVAQNDWGLQSAFDLERMTDVMLEQVRKKLNK